MPDVHPQRSAVCPTVPERRRPGGVFACACLIACLLLLFPERFPARAAETKPWTPVIEEYGATPERLIAVDKSRQKLSLFERRSPLQLARLFTCTTGQAVGDKEIEGDLKTPEGIYFVVQRIGSGLEYLKYGNEAYTLNYPNPVDRLRGKTGYGIWIHGRGEPIAPLQTQGCVSLNNEDLAVIAPLLVPGAPVALTESFSHSPAADGDRNAASRALEKKVRDWAQAWGSRSASLFDFYDKQAYAVAQGEAFSSFQAQKERLFRQLPWIKTTVRDIRVLQGPGYWVTWFYQDYRAPNLTTRGVRRLYWARDAAGDFKILGMEWAPGMTTGTLLASAEPALPPVEPQPRTEGQPLPPAPPATPPVPVLPAATPAPDPVAAARPVAAATPPSTPATTGQDGAALAMAPKAPDPSPATVDPKLPAAPVPGKTHFADHVEDPQFGKMAEPPHAARMMAALRAKNSAPARDEAAPSLELPPALPSQRLGDPEEKASAAQEPQDIAPAAPPAPTIPALPVPPAPVSPASTAAPDAPGASAEDIGSGIATLTAEWREAWESGNLDAYCAFYAPDAGQGSRRGAAAIRAHKSTLWKRAAPAAVKLEDIRIVTGKRTVTAEMRQDYTDSTGKGDRGVKTLIFQKIDGRWLITQEKWRALPDEADD